MNVFSCVLVIAIEWSGALVIDTSSTIVAYGLRETNDAEAASTGAATKDTASSRTISTVCSNDTTAERRWLMEALGDLYRPTTTPAHDILTATVTRQTTHEIVTANPSRPSWDSMDQGAMLRLLDSIAVTAIHATQPKHPFRQGKTTQYPYNADYGYEPYWAGNRPPEAGGKTPGDDDVSGVAADNSTSVEGVGKQIKMFTEPKCGDNVECSDARKEYGPVCARSSVHEKRTFKDVCAMEAETQCGNEEWVIVYRGSCEFGLWVQPTWRPHFKLHAIQMMQKTLMPHMKEWTTITHSSPIDLLPFIRLGNTYGYDVTPAPG